MRKNYAQAGVLAPNNRIHVENDWYGLGLPANIKLEEGVFIDTSYGFSGFASQVHEALHVGAGSGCYDRSSLVTGPEATISIGKFCILNGCTIICQHHVTIGNYCMMAWGSVLMDSWLNADGLPLYQRKALMEQTAANPLRPYPFGGTAQAIVLEDNCWVGFDAVVMPGVRLGRGCVVGCKTIVDRDVPPYAVVSGNPFRIIRYLSPTDQQQAS